MFVLPPGAFPQEQFIELCSIPRSRKRTMRPIALVFNTWWLIWRWIGDDRPTHGKLKG